MMMPLTGVLKFIDSLLHNRLGVPVPSAPCGRWHITPAHMSYTTSTLANNPIYETFTIGSGTDNAG